jgi:hypothetical protein
VAPTARLRSRTGPLSRANDAPLLQGAPTARIESISASSEWAVLRSRVLEALADHPDARLTLADALEKAEEDDDGSQE